MELTVLTVPDCPNEPLLEERLAVALAGTRVSSVTRRVIADERDAARWGLRGSPTLLVDGVDPFAGENAAVSMSCRIYRDGRGLPEGAPSVAALRRALTAEPPA